MAWIPECIQLQQPVKNIPKNRYQSPCVGSNSMDYQGVAMATVNTFKNEFGMTGVFLLHPKHE